MKAVTFHFRNLEPYQSLHRFILPFFNIHVGKLLTYVAIAHVQKVPFLQMHKRMSFKKSRAKILEETCNCPDF